ncbi:MAG: DsbA family protein [Gammaproteobacteria bacterium]|nr:DsbA family protein [Gammaproteobacteria bacterium]
MMPTLYHVHDPMCSWCYAFAPTWEHIAAAVTGSMSIQYVLGGLAPDSDQPMPEDLKAYIQNTWRRIQAVVPGTEFNFDFWTRCQPRRSTYPACRAVLAAKHFDADLERPMIERIQHAYYREARNPSDTETLCELAGEIGIDVAAFGDRLGSQACDNELRSEFEKRRALGVTGFPSLVLETDAGITLVRHDYVEPRVTLEALDELLGGGLGL